MRAMILAAGVGSRLDPLTRSIPKPLVPIVNKPVMEHIIELLHKHGFDEIVVNLHYLGHRIREHFIDAGAHLGVRIHWWEEDKLWGDAGSLKAVEWFFEKEDTFLVIGADDLTDMDLTALVATHRKKQALATIALSLVDDPSEYGIVMVDENERITRFLEKPKGEVIFSNTANTGVYVFDRKIFDLIPANTSFLFGRQVFPLLLKKGLPLYGHLTDAYWKDVGNLQVYQQTHRDVLAGRVATKLPFCEIRPGVWVGEDVVIDRTAEIVGPVVIGHYSTVGKNARVLEHTVLGNTCAVEEGATVSDSILWYGAIVMRDTHLERCVVGRGCNVSSNAAVFDGIIVRPERVK